MFKITLKNIRVPFKVSIKRFFKYWIFYFKTFGEISTCVLTTWWPPSSISKILP